MSRQQRIDALIAGPVPLVLLFGWVPSLFAFFTGSALGTFAAGALLATQVLAALMLLTAAVATVKEPVPYEPFNTKKSRWKGRSKAFRWLVSLGMGTLVLLELIVTLGFISDGHTGGFFGERFTMSLWALFGAVASLGLSLAASEEMFTLAMVSGGLWVITVLLCTVRGILALLRILPAHWREV